MTDLHDPELAVLPFNAGPHINVGSLTKADHGQPVTAYGTLTDLVVKTTDGGRCWAQGFLHDESGTVELLIFPATFAVFEDLIVEDARLVVSARVEARDLESHGSTVPQTPHLLATRLFTPEVSR